MMLPWEAPKSPISRTDYKRRSRFLLEFGGYVNPKLIHHEPCPPFVIQAEMPELERSIRAFIMDVMNNPMKVKSLIIRFIRAQNELVDAGKNNHLSIRLRLVPFKLTLDLNDAPFSWRKLMRLIHTRNYTKDREYGLAEIGLMLARATPGIRMAILIMASAGMRVEAVDLLHVKDIKSPEIDGRVVCGEVSVYARRR